ncbi:hypothetical protein C1645_788825 [Glomus cerebriforme]|uniref:Uncharacterized protein n=1 Tax=Glomus cerebriforme TaxID=658196 RepID=A0A397SI88_9GLOM|nr:hypothetical protein C1645_788825 [Glomus cerebriforme]
MTDLIFLTGHIIVSCLFIFYILGLFPQFFFSFIFISNLYSYTLFLTNSISLFLDLLVFSVLRLIKVCFLFFIYFLFIVFILYFISY